MTSHVKGKDGDFTLFEVRVHADNPTKNADGKPSNSLGVAYKGVVDGEHIAGSIREDLVVIHAKNGVDAEAAPLKEGVTPLGELA